MTLPQPLHTRSLFVVCLVAGAFACRTTPTASVGAATIEAAEATPGLGPQLLGGQGDLAFWASMMMGSVPSPTNVLASPLGSTTTAVNWTCVDGASAYRVYRSTDGVKFALAYETLSGGDCSYVDDTLDSSTTYYYRLSSLDIDAVESPQTGDSAYSVATTRPPGPVGGLVATGGTESIGLSWVPSAEPNVIGYRISRASSPDGTYTELSTSLVTATTYVDGAAPVLVRSYYKVQAEDGEGVTGEDSPIVSATASGTSGYNSPHQSLGASCDSCHDAHDSMAGVGPSACTSCHDGSGSVLDVATTLGGSPDSDHSISTDVSSGSNECADCHWEHDSGGGVARLLRVSIRGVEYYDGNGFCFACHGVGSHRSGGDHETAWAASAHGAAVPTPDTGTGIQCSSCHLPHAAQHGVDLNAATEEELCFGCHGPDNTAAVADVMSDFLVGEGAWTRHDITDADQAAVGSDIECSSCHNPHSATSAAPLVDPANPGPGSEWTGTVSGFCEVCHDDAMPTAVETGDWAAVLAWPTGLMDNDISTCQATQDLHGAPTGTAPVLRSSMGYAVGDSVGCDSCHVVHGGVNGAGLRSAVQSSDGASSMTAAMVYRIAEGQYDTRYFCRTCHDEANMGMDQAWPTNCSACHSHCSEM